MLEPLIILVLLAALVSAFNPYTNGVFILLCSVIYGRGQPSTKVAGLGLVYIATLCAASILGGVGLLYVLSVLPLIAMNYLVLGVGILVVCAGLLEIKDFFWYGQGISMGVPRIAAHNIRSLAKSRPRLASAVALGLPVTLVAIPSSSAPYVATIVMMHGGFGVDTISLLVLYSIIFCLPMIGMLLAITSGAKVSTFLRWKEETKGTFSLGIGLLLIALGWLLVLSANGVLNLA